LFVFLIMKRTKLFIVATILACGLMVPQKASAYKYYITLNNGEQVMFRASSKLQAVSYFRANYNEGVLTSRPGGGYLDQQ
jgi:serine protease inhibitor ecotin